MDESCLDECNDRGMNGWSGTQVDRECGGWMSKEMVNEQLRLLMFACIAVDGEMCVRKELHQLCASYQRESAARARVAL